MMTSLRNGLVVIAAVATSYGCAIASESPLGAAASQLLAKDLLTQMKGLENLRVGREELVTIIVNALMDPATDPLVRNHAIVNAGLYRVSEAVDPLLGLMSFVAVGPLSGSRSVGSVYPAVGALIQIGSPVPEQLLKDLPRLPTPIDDDSVKKITTVLIAIDGKELALQRIEVHLKRIATDALAFQAVNRIKAEVFSRSP